MPSFQYRSVVTETTYVGVREPSPEPVSSPVIIAVRTIRRPSLDANRSDRSWRKVYVALAVSKGLTTAIFLQIKIWNTKFTLTIFLASNFPMIMTELFYKVPLENFAKFIILFVFSDGGSIVDLFFNVDGI